MISKEAFKHYLVGSKDIDDEHWEILSSLEEFSLSKTKEEDIRIIERVLKLWEDHTVREATSMKKYNFPFAKYHLQEHDEIVTRFEVVKNKIINEDIINKNWIASELQVIVCSHIDRTDRQFSTHINTIK